MRFNTLFSWVILAFIALFFSFLPGIYGAATLNLSYIIRCLFYCLAIPLATCYSVQHRTEIPKRIANLACLLAILFSQFVTIGEFFYLADTFNIYRSLHFTLLIWFFQSILWFVILFPILKYAIAWFENYKINDSIDLLNYKKLFVVALILRFFCFIIFYPGLFDYDGAIGLRQMLKPGMIISNHHPYFIQLFHASFFKLGAILFKRPDIGIALISIVWIFISSLIIIYATKTVSRLTDNAKFTKIIGYFFAVFPIFPFLSIYITKDGFFAYFFLLYIACLLQMYITKGFCLRKPVFCLLFALTMIFVCFTRNQGIYIIVIQSAYLIWIYRKQFIRIVGLCAIPVLLFIFVNNYYFPNKQIEPASKAESYGMLFQQTALYLKTYPKDITDIERKAINAILSVDSLPKLYTPYITDAVKGSYHYGIQKPAYSPNDTVQHPVRRNHDGESIALRDYRTAWFSMFLKHPDAAFNAEIAVIWPFFYSGGGGIFFFNAKWADSNATSPEYSFYHFVRPADALSKILCYLAVVPIFDILFGMATFTWLSIFLICLIAWRRNWNGFSIYLPTLLSLLFLCVCPVASSRYIYPIIVSLPLLFSFALKIKKHE